MTKVEIFIHDDEWTVVGPNGVKTLYVDMDCTQEICSTDAGDAVKEVAGMVGPLEYDADTDE